MKLKINDIEISNPVLKVISFIYLLTLLIINIIFAVVVFICLVPVEAICFIKAYIQENTNK